MTLQEALSTGWEFRRLDQGAAGSWIVVELPHTPFLADLNAANHWFGLCEYRRTIELDLKPEESAALSVGAAMHTATVFVDGRETAIHRGGYLPFEVDLTEPLRAKGACQVTLRLDNRDAPDVPPGKPFSELDFCWFGGLYRQASLIRRPSIHITDAVAAAIPAGGGVFIQTIAADSAVARVSLTGHVRNASNDAKSVALLVEIYHQERLVASARSPDRLIAPHQSVHLRCEATIANPRLWSVDSPELHHAKITVCAADGALLDARVERFGIRRISFSREKGFLLNGKRVRLRGTNRHQEGPAVGYALSAAEQHRDARRIKEAGFDYVRLSHYPQSPDFLDACDELGIVVMNCIPGWQYLGGVQFREACYSAARDLIRRDRNHPCVVLWELSLNETEMDPEFMAELNRIGHEEFPGDQMFTCGWMDAFDVFIRARQHGGLHHWRNGDRALVVSEYGDWEFFASNAGFDQTTGAGVFERWSTSRQFRSDGERGLRQQVINHIVALNDTLGSPAVLDGQWAMFDYSRGYDPVRAAVGVMDVFRLPKFSFHFYRSQRHAEFGATQGFRAPNVFIASHWIPGSVLQLLVFSNCDEVELSLNGEKLGRKRPSLTSWTQHLPHPPFIFEIESFTPGTLEAIGYLANRACTSHRVRTPGPPHELRVWVDHQGVLSPVHEPDTMLAHAEVVDAEGTLCIEDNSEIHFSGVDAEILSAAVVRAEAGIASAVLKMPAAAKGFELHAEGLLAGQLVRRTVQWPRSEVSIVTPSSHLFIPSSTQSR